MATSRYSGAALLRRRRISHACDQCHELRTKCNGQRPCSHCVDYTLVCEYARERKKRGKAANPTTQTRARQDSKTCESQATEQSVNTNPNANTNTGASPATEAVFAAAITEEFNMQGHESNIQDVVPYSQHVAHDAGINHNSLHIDQGMMEISGFTNMDIGQTASMESEMLAGFTGLFQPPPQSPEARSISQSTHSLSSTVPQDEFVTVPSPSNTSGSGSGSGRTSQPVAGRWGQQPPSNQQSNNNRILSPKSTLTYPVLRPILGCLKGIMPVQSACDLLEFYFSSSWSAHMHPASPYVLGFVFRKESILHATDPRPCERALLASMLWVAAQTSDLGMLTGLPHAREQLCTTLMNLTLKLLKSPATRSVNKDNMEPPPEPGTGGFDLDTSSILSDMCQLDNIATYIHLAVIASASEFKGASIKWWSTAWELARQLKLGREVPAGDFVAPVGDHPPASPLYNEQNEKITARQWTIKEEQREERRRIWWLLYAVDRHLALCYNRPLTLLDVECQGLLQPMDDIVWQSGSLCGNDGSDGHNSPRVGPQIECTGYSIFGYFVPLMTLLGDIVDLQHSKNHPRLGVNGRAVEMWNVVADEIRSNLQVYECSLSALEEKSHIAGTGKSGYPTQKHQTDTSAVTGQLGGFTSNKSNTDGSSTARTGAGTIMVMNVSLDNDHGTNINNHPDIDTNNTNQNDTNGNTRLAAMVFNSVSNQITENEIYTRMVVAYSRHVLHVLHILLAGRWDPVSLFDDRDPWISTESFITATGHAVSAADEIAKILQFDPGLEFMPFFWGIYLLQGSFLPLLIADMLQRQTSPHIVKSCETIMQAHEASVVTLRTEYQRDFSKLMRTAIAAVRGRVPSDLDKHYQWRRELLSRYRWNGKGTGLVL